MLPMAVVDEFTRITRRLETPMALTARITSKLETPIGSVA